MTLAKKKRDLSTNIMQMIETADSLNRTRNQRPADPCGYELDYSNNAFPFRLQLHIPDIPQLVWLILLADECYESLIIFTHGISHLLGVYIMNIVVGKEKS